MVQKMAAPIYHKKCVSLHIGYRNTRHVYKMEGIQLKQVTEEKDLGVTMDQELKFLHQTAAVKKANCMLAIMKNSFAVLNVFTLPRLFKALVRPLLEYSTVIWGPQYKLVQQALEKKSHNYFLN